MRGAIVLLAGLAFAAPATAAPPAVTASATPSAGIAPQRVTLEANGDAALYAWDLGDGTTAAGALVTHVYSAGRFTATVTATNAAGEDAGAGTGRRLTPDGLTHGSAHGQLRLFTGSVALLQVRRSCSIGRSVFAGEVLTSRLPLLSPSVAKIAMARALHDGL